MGGVGEGGGGEKSRFSPLCNMGMLPNGVLKSEVGFVLLQQYMSEVSLINFLINFSDNYQKI